MTNLKKSKIFLIILCLFGMAFSYSCSCRNGEKFGSDGTFDVSQNDNNVKNLIVRQDGTTFNREINILFTEHNGYKFTANLESVKGENDALSQDFNYNKTTGKVSVNNSDILNNLSTDGTKKNYELNFKVEADDKDLKNPTTNFTIPVTLQKTVKLDGTIIQKSLVELGNFSVGNFLFNTTTAGTDKLTVQNAGSQTGKDDKISPIAFQNELKTMLNLQNVKGNYYSEANPDGDPVPSGKLYIFKFKFTPTIEYEGDFIYTVEADAISKHQSSTGNGSWDTGTK